MRPRQLLTHVLPLVLWGFATWTVSAASRPNEAFSIGVEVPDKLAHITEFAIGGFLAARVCALISRWPGWMSEQFASKVAGPLLATVLCALWGVLDEVHQSYVPLRTPDVHDALADLFGAALGASLFVWWAKLRATAALARASR